MSQTSRTDESVPAASSDPVRRGRILGALMLSMGLVAIDSTIVATAVPAVVKDLGGFAQFPWLFSVYLLTQAVTVPLYGRVADVVGRKPVLFFGIGVFVTGSVLCGAAWNMTGLVVFRAIQGLGAGAVQPMTTTIVGDLYSVQERGRIQGYLSSVWGVSAVVGPTLGGFFTAYLTWRLIFFVNVPVAAATIVMLSRHFPERVEGVRRRHRVDGLGTATLVTGCSLLILGLLDGTRWGWHSATTVTVLALGAVLLGGFVLAERYAAEPVLPLWTFGRRTLLAGNLAALSVGAITLGLSSYVPTYVQGVLGTGAVVAGFTLAALSAGWPLASSQSGRVYGVIGFRDTALLGSVFVVGGTVLFATLPFDVALWRVALASFVVGVGLGFSATSTVVAVQSVVGWNRRGVVTGANMFTRAIGSAVGVAVFGAIANSTISSQLRHAPAALAGRLPHSLDAETLIFAGGTERHGPVGDYLRHSLYLGVHHIYWALVVVAAAGAVFQAIMPRRTTELVFAEDGR